MSMTESEAISELQQNIDLDFGCSISDEASRMAILALEEVQKYRAIGTVSEFRELKEKATAKKPIKTYYGGMPTFLCPVCEEEVCEGQKYCDECGQAVMKLDWSEGKE